MVKKGITVFLVILSLILIFPVVFLAVGSMMGKNELTELLRPVLESGNKGYASWKILPQYPTLKNYVEILLDSPEFPSENRKPGAGRSSEHRFSPPSPS